MPLPEPWWEGDGASLLVVAFVQRGDEVLLVRQPGPRGPVWALLGGRVDAGELLIEALARKLREETGLELRGEPRLL